MVMLAVEINYFTYQWVAGFRIGDEATPEAILSFYISP